MTADMWLNVTIGAGVVLAFFGLWMWAARHLLYVCRPNEILVFSGRERTTADGRTVGFQVVPGGRAFRIPIVERVERMDIRLITVPMAIRRAYSSGGIPLSVNAVANVKVSTDSTLIGNAIERFLGHPTQEIARVAKETLEGHVRGVLATMSPEEVNEDRLTFASRLEEEAAEDLNKLGLQLDTLKIQHVSDDVNYLDSIGRKRIAEILRTAEVAESDAARNAAKAEAAADSRAKVAQQNARARVQVKVNEMRRIIAELDAKARTEEEQVGPAADAARARAEKALQAARASLERLRAMAEVTIPAEIDQQVAQLEAAGRAAPISENGAALAEAMATIAKVWEEAGDKAMEIVVLQNLEELFGRVADAASKLDVQDVSLIDAGDGSTLPNYVASYPATLRKLLGEVEKTLGVNITTVTPHERAPVTTGGNS